MNTWQISTTRGPYVCNSKFIKALHGRGFVVKYSRGQPDMYKTFDARFYYTVSHKDEREITLFVLAFDASGLDMRITEI
jgi:predicted RNA binding protein YcfA (HicA-like mRNA interferase family)